MHNTNTIGQLSTEHSRRFQARALGAMFGAGAGIGLVAVVVPHGPGVNAMAWALNSTLGLPTAGALVWRGDRTPAWMLHTLLVVGAAMVSLGVLFGGGGTASVATSFFFVWVALYACWFFTPRAAVLHIVADVMLFAGAIRIEGVAGGPAVWLVVSGTTVVVGVVVSIMRRQLIRAITLDPLTGLPTRHTLITEFEHHITRAQRQGSRLCVAIIDVDGLKTVNDRDGHHAGDQALADCARAWRAALRDRDVLVRHGGDEFVALLPDCPPDAGIAVIDRLRAAGPVGCSAGLAWWAPGDTAAEVLARADAELYHAKRAIAAPVGVCETCAMPRTSSAGTHRPATVLS